MAQIEELESRIAAAFQRISDGVVVLASRQAEPADDGARARLEEELEAERLTNAQLNERLRALSNDRSATETALRDEIAALTRALDEQGLDIQRLTATVTSLREDLRRLREGAEGGVTDPALINRAMLAELEALRATRAAEAHEMADILAALGPVLDAEEARANA